MKETTLLAQNRTGKPKQLRREGFIPGVLNSSDTTSFSVQFEAGPLKKLVSQQGPSAKLRVSMDGTESVGFIKEIQRNPVDSSIVHVAIQLVRQDESIRLALPITYHNREDLEYRDLLLTIVKAEVTVAGKPADMPNHIAVDLTGREADSTITPEELNLPAGLELQDAEDEIYAVVKQARRMEEADVESEVVDASAVETVAESKEND
ncbi:MAG: 50S ribosomal protein L25 [Saccharofermentanales bacterium]|jgi:large subunit ribosomal protein L25